MEKKATEASFSATKQQQQLIAVEEERKYTPGSGKISRSRQSGTWGGSH